MCICTVPHGGREEILISSGLGGYHGFICLVETLYVPAPKHFSPAVSPSRVFVLNLGMNLAH